MSNKTIQAEQLAGLRKLLGVILPGNRFYARKLQGTKNAAPATLEEFFQFPFTTKPELAQDQQDFPPYGSNLTFPLEAYVRCHQTSGTSGRPLRWLDTQESWDWMLETWKEVYRAAGVGEGDRVYFAFSFGPFLGFWTAFEAAASLGCLCFPGGGLSSAARLREIIEHRVTVLCCTPTYSLRLAEVGRQEGLDLNQSAVRRIIVAGEPGGSIPATRSRIEELWPGARVVDHHGMTEVGPVSFECPERPGRLHIREAAYLAEIVHPESGLPQGAGAPGELVLTPLGRTGSPLLRYRTGDLVRTRPDLIVSPACLCGRFDLSLEGGILGRVDDMVIVRGVNLHPSAVEEVVRSCPGIAEYQARIFREKSLVELEMRVESLGSSVDETALKMRLEKLFQDRFSLRVPVRIVPQGSLPRFELKARRWLREDFME
jgi:phenylacetate-CoA ligase